MGASVDVLVHLDDPRIDDVGAWLADVAQQGISDVVWAGTDPLRDPRCARLDVGSRAGNDANSPVRSPITNADASVVRVWHAAGIHPRYLSAQRTEEQLALLREALQEGARAGLAFRAVGEIGLDGREDSPPSPLQERGFIAQLALAREHALPVILHCVHRIGRLVELLDAHGAPNGGVMHGFAGPSELVPRLADMGLAFSFGGLLLNPHATRVRDAACAVPDALLLMESDAPDLETSQWPRLVAELATLRNTTPAAIAALTSENARRIFRMTTSK